MKKNEETKIWKEKKNTHTHNLVIFKHKHKISNEKIVPRKEMHKQTDHRKLVKMKKISKSQNILESYHLLFVQT